MRKAVSAILAIAMCVFGLICNNPNSLCLTKVSDKDGKITIIWGQKNEQVKAVNWGHKETITFSVKCNLKKADGSVNTDQTVLIETEKHNTGSTVTGFVNKVTLKPGQAMNFRLEAIIAFTHYCQEEICVNVRIEGSNSYESFYAIYSQITSWDACFAENGKKELSVITDDIVSKDVVVKITNKDKHIVSLELESYAGRYFQLGKYSSVTINMGTKRLTDGKPIVIEVLESTCASRFDTQRKEIKLKLRVRNNSLGKLPEKLASVFEKTLPERKYNDRYLFMWDKEAYLLRQTFSGCVLGTANTTKKQYYIKLIGTDGLLKWSYRTNLDNSKDNFFIDLLGDKLILVDRANDGKVDTIDYVWLKNGKLAKQIRLPGYANANWWYDYDNPSGQDKDLIRYLELGIKKYEDYGVFKTIYLDVESGAILDAIPKKKTISKPDRIESSQIGPYYAVFSYTLKRFVGNKLSWQATFKKPGYDDFNLKAQYEHIGSVECKDSVFLTISNYQKSEGASPSDELIRLDIKTGKIIWRKNFWYTLLVVYEGKLYTTNLTSNYMVVYDEFTGKLLGATKLQTQKINSTRTNEMGIKNGLIMFDEVEHWTEDVIDEKQGPTKKIHLRYVKVELPKQ